MQRCVRFCAENIFCSTCTINMADSFLSWIRDAAPVPVPDPAQTGGKKPAVKKPAAKKPAVKKPAAKKPAAKKPKAKK